MSGKPKQAGLWGGKREGAGRPAYMVPANRVKSMIRKMRKAKRELGIDEDDLLVSIITEGKAPWPDEEKASIRDALAAVKLFKEYTMTRQSEQNITVTKDRGMAIRLPPKQPDPALEIFPGGKK